MKTRLAINNIMKQSLEYAYVMWNDDRLEIFIKLDDGFINLDSDNIFYHNDVSEAFDIWIDDFRDSTSIFEASGYNMAFKYVQYLFVLIEEKYNMSIEDFTFGHIGYV